MCGDTHTQATPGTRQAKGESGWERLLREQKSSSRGGGAFPPCCLTVGRRGAAPCPVFSFRVRVSSRPARPPARPPVARGGPSFRPSESQARERARAREETPRPQERTSTYEEHRGRGARSSVRVGRIYNTCYMLPRAHSLRSMRMATCTCAIARTDAHCGSANAEIPQHRTAVSAALHHILSRRRAAPGRAALLRQPTERHLCRAEHAHDTQPN